MYYTNLGHGLWSPETVLYQFTCKICVPFPNREKEFHYNPITVSVFIIAFIRAPLIDINEIHELVSRSLLYGGKNDSNRLIIKECVAKGVSKSFLSLS